jgi:acyl dehydratase
VSDNYVMTASVDDITARVGQEIGASRWYEMSQARIDAFADVTEDWFFIHTNPEKAATETPWGGTIAHGFLTVSLLSAMAYEVVPGVEGASRSVNYGFDRLRFVAPVPVGSRVRGRFTLTEAVTDKPGEVTLKYATVIEIEGQEVANGGRPAVAADWITREFFD